MGSMAVVEAEVRLADLLDRVEGGESITITRSGRPVAVLAPVQKRDRADVIRDLLELSKGRKLHGESIRDMIDEGRRF